MSVSVSLNPLNFSNVAVQDLEECSLVHFYLAPNYRTVGQCLHKLVACR